VKDLSKHMIKLDVCGSICTDGAPVMLRKSWGFLACVKEEVFHIKIAHFTLHYHVLAAKTSPTKLNDTSSITASAVKFIIGSAHLSRALC
jgi:hypothetical protein